MEISKIGGSPNLLNLVNNDVKSKAPSNAMDSFAEMLSSAIEESKNIQSEADAMIAQLVSGGSIDIHDVILATEKAGISLQLMLQVRNRLLEAYQEVMHMQV